MARQRRADGLAAAGEKRKDIARNARFEQQLTVLVPALTRG